MLSQMMYQAQDVLNNAIEAENIAYSAYENARGMAISDYMLAELKAEEASDQVALAWFELHQMKVSLGLEAA